MADTLNGEEMGAYVPTEKLLPTCGAHRASEAPTDLAMTMDASVQMSAATCLVGVPDATAILRATLFRRPAPCCPMRLSSPLRRVKSPILLSDIPRGSIRASLPLFLEPRTQPL